MRFLATIALVALLGAGCAAAEGPATPTAPPRPQPPATLPVPAAGTPPPQLPPATSQATPAEPAPVPDDELEAQLQQLLDEWLADSGAPGAALGVRLADGSSRVVVAGETDDAGGQAVEAEHRFRIGSITKTFVAALLVQLAEEGLLGLDDQLADYLPQAPHAEQVTLRQLLNHTSGVPDFGRQPAYQQQLLDNPARSWQPRDTLELVAGLPLDFEPGSSWSYSNTNYTLAALVAEEATGQPLAELLRERVSRPAGLESTYLEGLEDSPPIDTAGHFDIDGDGTAENVRIIPYTALVSSGAAAGGLSSTAADVLDFSAALFGSELLSAEGLAELTATPPVHAGYALGLSVFQRDGQLFWGHAGALPGYSALFAHAADEAIDVVLLANQSGVNTLLPVEAAFGLAQAAAEGADR